MKISLLTKTHQRTAFNCGNPTLNKYIKQLASQHSKQNVNRTYVAHIDQRVIGFYTLSNAQIEFEKIKDLLPKRYPPHYPVPMARLGRFAVDKTVQGQGIGKALLFNALYRCYVISKEIGTVGIVVDAKDEKAKDFYQYYGFVEIQPLTLILLTKTIEQLFQT